MVNRNNNNFLPETVKDILQINVVRCLVIRGRKAAEETARSPYRQYFMCISVAT